MVTGKCGAYSDNYEIDNGNITDFAVTAPFNYTNEYYLYFVYIKSNKVYYKCVSIGFSGGFWSNIIEPVKDLTTGVEVLQNKGEPDITLRNVSNDPNNINMQPVITFKGQYTVIIIVPSGGDGASQPISQTYYPIVYREKISTNNWANANFQFLSSIPQQNPNIEGSKRNNSYLVNFSRNNTTFYQKVGRWNGWLNSYYCSPSTFTGKDAKLIRGALVDNGSTSQKIITLSNSAAPYQVGTQPFTIYLQSNPNEVDPDAVSAVITNNNLTYSFYLGSIIVNGQLINFYPDMDSLIDTPAELNDNLESQPFLLNENDTLIIGRNAFYLDAGGGEFSEVQYAVYLTNNSTGEKFLELARDTVRAGDSINVEYLEGFVIQNIPGGSDSFFVQMEIDTVWAGGGDDFGLNSISTDLGGLGDSPALKKMVFWKNAKVINNNIPTAFNLYQNFPNPFNPVTKIKYDLPKNVNVTIKIYDIIGREVTTLVNNEFKNAGRYEVNWNANNYASGVYIYRLQAGDYVSTKKMVLIK